MEKVVVIQWLKFGPKRALQTRFQIVTEPIRTSTSQGERRQRRSHDPITALHYQLAAVRRAASLQAVVLVDDSGCLVAGAGAWPVCEGLAAYAPLLAEPPERLRTIVSMRIATLSKEASVLPIELEGQNVLLCSRGGADSSELLGRAAEGVRRILA